MGGEVWAWMPLYFYDDAIFFDALCDVITSVLGENE